MPAGNTKLVDYGILQEESDIRAHVGVVAEAVYVFPTHEAIELVQSGLYPQLPVKTASIITARGYPIPWIDIPHCKEIKLPNVVMQTIKFSEKDTTSEKGMKAVAVVKWLLKAGLMPLWLESEIIHDHEMQIKGTDILVRLNTKIQVKCDYKAGNGRGCKGNLFIQIAECNPFKRY